MNALTAHSGAIGFDTDTVITPDIAAVLAKMRFAFAVRYVSRVTPNNPGDISQAEVGVINASLALMLVQHCPPAYWTPTRALGIQYGAAAASNALGVGYAAGATLWLDLENMRPGSSPSSIFAYANAWFDAVENEGYQSGLYYSADVPLTPEQLYIDLITQRYWRGLSRDAPLVAVRGACMQQYLQAGQVAGVDIDRNVITADAFGGLPVWSV